MRNERPRCRRMAGSPTGGRECQGGPREALAATEDGHHQTRLTPLLSGADRWPWGRGGVFNLRRKRGTSPGNASPLPHPPSFPQHPPLSPGVLGLLAPSPIKGDNLLSADASFTHGALLPLWPCLQPLRGKMKWFPVYSRVLQLLRPPHLPLHLFRVRT